MEFLAWHYTEGVDYYISRWVSLVRWVIHYFSLSLLLKTLFAPWKRLVDEDKSPGFNISRYFETLTFNLISRGIGAVVRLALFFVGLIILFFIFFGGALGLLIWFAIPLFGLPPYLKIQNSPEKLIENLLFKIKQGENLIKTVFESEPGQFILAHVGLTAAEAYEKAAVKDGIFLKFSPKNFEEIIKKLLDEGVWSEEFLRKMGLEKSDFILAAQMWDKIASYSSELATDDILGRPGMGLELLFGYTPTLNQYSLDLSAPVSYSHRLIGREEIVSRMERALTSGASVVLVGAPGVGKKTVVLEFAHRAAQGKLGREMAYRRILEFDYNSFLSESIDLNLKKAKLGAILNEAAYAGNIILMVRDIHRLTNPEVEGFDFTDTFEEYMEKKDLKIIAVSTPAEYERFIAPNLRLRKFLKEVEVTPPTKDEAMQIILEAAIRWESIKNFVITIPTLRKILDESDRYISEVPFPEKALELLDAVIYYREQKGGTVVSVDDADRVLEEKTGISFAHLTGEEKKRLGNLEEIIHERLVDQEAAVSLIARSLRARSVGVAKESRPVGSFLFLGPTGVGKTETAKVLAKVYYGSADHILRFDMAEFAGKEGLERLIGSVESNQPGALTTAIKNRPASLLLLDEIEKAPPEIFNLFLALLDEGSITDAFGRKINGRHLFVIATSNAGAEYIRQLVNKETSPNVLQTSVVNYVLEKGIFTPEFLNRFDGVVVYEPLKHEDLAKVAKLLLEEMAENLKQKNIYLIVTDEAAEKVAYDGFDPAFGARPMRRIIDLVLGDLIGRAVIRGEINPSDKIKIVPGQNKDEYSWEKVE